MVDVIFRFASLMSFAKGGIFRESSLKISWIGALLFFQMISALCGAKLPVTYVITFSLLSV